MSIKEINTTVAIFKNHAQYYREIFALPKILQGPLLTIGFQEMSDCEDLHDFCFSNLKDLLASYNVKDVVVLDPFDSRAELHYDLNVPVPKSEYEKYRVLMDIGSLEHIFDTKQVLENCMRMTGVGGLYFLHTPVNGYMYHGLHVFNPMLITEAFRLNGFDILYLRYSSKNGIPLNDPAEAPDSLIWLVGRKTMPIDTFKIPQQTEFFTLYQQYQKRQIKEKIQIKKIIKYWIKQICPPIILRKAKNLFNKSLLPNCHSERTK